MQAESSSYTHIKVADKLPAERSPEIGEHVVVNFKDGCYVEEVKTEAANRTVDVNYMKTKEISTADLNEGLQCFWIWPAKKDIVATRRNHVLPVRPGLVMAKPSSTRRIVVFSVENG